ncbi:hypothetical protein Tco_1506927 [Tanacetum coccineum]
MVDAPGTPPQGASCIPHEHLRVIEDLSTRMGNLEYGHGQLVKKVIQVSDAEVAMIITIGNNWPQAFLLRGTSAVTVSQMVQVVYNSMQCILGMDRRLADLERRPPGP